MLLWEAMKRALGVLIVLALIIGSILEAYFTVEHFHPLPAAAPAFWVPLAIANMGLALAWALPRLASR